MIIVSVAGSGPMAAEHRARVPIGLAFKAAIWTCPDVPSQAWAGQ